MGSDDAANYARRSPWPMINILRTPQVRKAQKAIPTGLVYRQNEVTLDKIGSWRLQRWLVSRDWSEVKDNYRVSGMTVAGGSPAFTELTACEDAFVIEQLRSQGAVLIGKTNMPPLADGGMQRGLYGRAESPYNPAFLAAAFGSGSSQGSAVAVAANLCAFALGSETVSSGRSPASNNSLVTYTPSRGLISLRGVWPLFALRDVVTPYTRSVTDLLLILDALMMPDTIR